MERATLSSLTSLRILIPILLILVTIALFIRAFQITRESIQQHQRENIKSNTLMNRLAFVLLLIYLLVYIWLTLLYRRPTKNPQINLTLFWSYREAFSFQPFRIRRLGLAREILLNILLTIPLGLLLPLLFHQRKHPYVITIIITMILSILTETIQYLAHLGLCETDDMIDNLLGCCLGMGILFAGTSVLKRKM